MATIRAWRGRQGLSQLQLFDTPPTPEAVRAHFDPVRAKKKREEGLHLVETNNKEFVELMRGQARRFCAVNGEVHIDDLRRFALSRGIRPESSNAWGAVFRGKCWAKIGRRKSTLVTNKGHESPVWAFREGGG